MSISISSPGKSLIFFGIYLVFLVRYLLVRFSLLIIFPIVLGCIAVPSFFSFQCNFKALRLVSFLNFIICSLTLIGVSLGSAFGLVDLFISPANPRLLYLANQYFKALSEKGDIKVIFLIVIPPSIIGLIHLNFSSWVEFGIVFIP